MSMRAAGVTVVTYLNSSAALARAGRGEGPLQQQVQDTVVTLTDTSAREIEVCAEMDVARGKVRRMEGMEDGRRWGGAGVAEVDATSYLTQMVFFSRLTG